MEAEDSDAENLQSAEELHLNAHRALVLWARGSLAEQQGEYAAAKAFFTDRLDAGNVVWVKKALPTLGWALMGLGELAEAQAYFQQVCDDAEQRHVHPTQLDAQVGLMYRAQKTVQLDQHQPTAVVDILRAIHQHPAANPRDAPTDCPCCRAIRWREESADPDPFIARTTAVETAECDSVTGSHLLRCCAQPLRL